MTVMWTDLFCQSFFGVGSIIALIYLYRDSDEFSDGNVGADE